MTTYYFKILEFNHLFLESVIHTQYNIQFCFLSTLFIHSVPFPLSFKECCLSGAASDSLLLFKNLASFTSHSKFHPMHLNFQLSTTRFGPMSSISGSPWAWLPNSYSPELSLGCSLSSQRAPVMPTLIGQWRSMVLAYPVDLRTRAEQQ